MGDRDILAPDNRQGTKLVKTKSSSAESVGRARFHSRFNTGAVFDEANGLLAPMERLPKIDGARRPQAARTPTMAEFATSIAHEISQPLTSVVLNAEASLRWLTRNDPDLEEARRAILAVAKEGMRAGEMIRSLLALVRLSQPVLAVCDINDVIHDVLTRIHEVRQRHGVLLSLNLFTDNRCVFGSRVQLQRVWCSILR
jgi:signal transduction histidine kinase